MELNNKNFMDFVEALNKNLVEYCIVGAYAVGYHAKPRDTGVIDFIIRNTKENAGKVLKAITDFGFGSVVEKLKIDDLTVRDTIIQLGYEPNRIDVHTSIAGVDFDDAWKNKNTGKLGVIKAYFIGINELLKSKKASVKQRENNEKYYKDMHDIEALKRVMSMKRRRGLKR